MTEGKYLKLKSGHRLWYAVHGGGVGLPLLVLHGGPGTGHDYLENLAKLSDERTIIFYDQLGCGRSDKPDDNALWRIERFADEVDEVRAQLGLQHLHILGQSFGGYLLIEYLSRKPKGLASVILASTASSMAQFSADIKKRVTQLPQHHQDALCLYGAGSDFQHPNYVAAVDAFNRNFLCRIAELPDCIARTGANVESSKSNSVMSGPNQFTVGGNMKDWDRSQEIRNIQIPALITCGEFDEIGPDCATALHSALSNSELRVFDGCSHTAHLEDEENYLRVVREFLAKNDR